MWRFIVPLGLFVVLAAFFYAGLGKRPDQIPSPLIGKPAPQFTLPSAIDDQPAVDISRYHGRPYVLNVWATWCVGCREEHETLLQIARSEALPIIGLAWKDDRAKVQRWLNQLGNPYVEVAFDPDGRVAIDWGVYGAPETFLIGPDGRVLYKLMAPMTPEIWEREFLPRVRSASSGSAS